MGSWNKPTVQGSLSSNVFPVVSGAAPGGFSWYKHEAFQEYALRLRRVAKVFTEPSSALLQWPCCWGQVREGR